MNKSPSALAQHAQLQASNPLVSAFVAASAGSGKTKLLTDRLLRLMLGNVPPGRILCLTFTKAAAAEMALRLRAALGQWVTMDDAGLDAALAALAIAPDAAMRARARRLFGLVLDLPGGMRITTIHAFCQSLLRRFPLEAGISPHFALADDADSASRRRSARETILADGALFPAIESLAAQIGEAEFAGLISQLAAAPDGLGALLSEFGQEGLIAMQLAALNAPDGDDNTILHAAVTWRGEASLRAVLLDIAQNGTPAAAKRADGLLDWLGRPPDERVRAWDEWSDIFLTGKGEPRAISGFLRKNHDPALAAVIQREQDRILAVAEQRAALNVALLSASLIKLAGPMLARDRAAKAQAAQLDYADLILRGGALLTDPGAAWVLYKLDGGIDHLLLDEVQDTAPAQWHIVDAITREFFAGLGARDVQRSVFAVGDRKQSIFSFQGADPASFAHWRDVMRERVSAADRLWHDGALSVSFRSAPPILALTDAVFDDSITRLGVLGEAETLSHIAHRAGQAGSVTLWPPTPSAAVAELPPWSVPDDYSSQEAARPRLARQIAAWIAGQIGTMRIASRGRALAAGDILVLVRSRNEFIPVLMRALKDHGVPVAGADRMLLTAQRAVADLLSLCDALLLPEDDLAMATWLTSPLGDLADDSLMALALGRTGRLYEALAARAGEREDWRQAQGFFTSLRARADFLSPYHLLVFALGHQGARGRLLGRLGPEANEPIDECLSAALEYAAKRPASLQGFVQYFRQSGAEIKREPEAAGDLVRVMTVHGAKGLQAPLVILAAPSTSQPARELIYWLDTPQQGQKIPVLCPRAALRSAAVMKAVQAEKQADLAEENRLLYVALTRAEDHLLVCGTEPGKAMSEQTWYAGIKRGFARLAGITTQSFEGPWPGDIMALDAAQTAAPDKIEPPTMVRAPVELPGWIGTRMAPETTRPEPIAPSRSAEGAQGSLAAASPLVQIPGIRRAALARGRLIHSLLQHLPAIEPGAREQAMASYLASSGHGIDPVTQRAIATDVQAILGHPSLSALFGPGSRAEIPIAGIVNDLEIGGLIDRILITPERIVLADFKTDRRPPADLDHVPVAYLRQLASYCAILAQIYPDRPIEALLIWTETACIMSLPRRLLDRYAPTAQALA